MEQLLELSKNTKSTNVLPIQTFKSTIHTDFHLQNSEIIATSRRYTNKKRPVVFGMSFSLLR
jgi:hypothetical protein